VLTFTPTLDAATGTYEVQANTILCNNMNIFHDAITGSTTLAALVAQMNVKLAAMGTWSVLNATQIQLTGTACTSVVIGWLQD
jgi:hypothetical protein